MTLSPKLLCSCLILLACSLNLSGCGCGFDCHSDDDDGGNVGGDPAVLTLGLSDSLPEDLQQVVIEVDSITFHRSGAADVKIDDFTVLGQDRSTFQVNLLDYPGTAQLRVIEGLELDRGTYSGISIAIIDTDLNNSYVVEKTNNTQKRITVSNGILNLPGMQLASGVQAVTVEFGLAQALQFQSGSDTYLLATTGIRVENNATAATLSGAVDSALFNGASPCIGKNPPTTGNRIYLYQGTGLTNDRLVDVYTNGSANFPPTTAVAPFAVATLIQNENTQAWEYTFGYLPAGDYTLAFSCNTATDDAVQYNALQIPLPTNQKYDISLAATQKRICNLTTGGGCPSTQ